MKIINKETQVFQENKLKYAPLLLTGKSSAITSDISKLSSINKINQETPKSNIELEILAKEVNKLSENKNVSLNFDLDQKTGKTFVQFIDNKTKEVIKQVPSEEMLKIALSIDDFLNKNSSSFPPGFLINEKI